MDTLIGTITRRMDSLINRLQSEFKLFCDVEAFINKLDALKVRNCLTGVYYEEQEYRL